jgi:hypothetical protein
MGVTAGILDIIFLFIIFLLFRRFTSGTLIVDNIAILLILIVFFALLTMLAFRVTQTSWINIFRSNLFAMGIYTFALNYRKHIQVSTFKYPFVLINIFNLWVLFSNWSTGFTHHSLESSYFNLNNIGIISLLIMIMSLTLLIKDHRYKFVHLTNLALSCTLVILSFSRSNYLMLIVVVTFSLIFILDLKGRANFIVLVGALITFLFFQGFESDIFNYGLSFLDKKVNAGTTESILSGRLHDVAILPIERYLQDRPFFYIFLGGSLLPEHSLLVTHITCFGLISLVIYLMLTFSTTKCITNNNKAIKLVSLLMLVLFINDSSTNASSYILFVKLVPLTFFCLIINEINEKHKILTW